MTTVNRVIWLLHSVVISVTVVIVICTRVFDSQKELLRSLTGEIGPFELGSIFLLLLLSGIAFFNLRSLRRQDIPAVLQHRLFIGAVGILSVLAALEESSWGQHFFSFEPNQFFATYNQQQETNLHNLLPPEIFGLLVNASLYVMFVYIPLVLYLWSDSKLHKAFNGSINRFAPSLHTIIIFCFGFSLQAYFKLETLTDSLALAGALLVLAYLLFVRRDESWASERLHYAVLLVTTALFALCYEVFSFENVQYEIREFVFVYGFISWFIHYTIALRNAGGKAELTFIRNSLS